MKHKYLILNKFDFDKIKPTAVENEDEIKIA
jgi:hypothetical protein